MAEEQYRGREVINDLPVVVNVKDQEIRSVHVRYGVREALRGDLAERPSFDEPFQTKADSPALPERMQIAAEGLSARLTIGATFVAEIDLKQ
ncbi:hypothetical protein [Methylocapsa sp. S129]|uniref:hypothetical protein n=1 Tax=Methylocapsa sp. S129 TaxID=1641869 RepID=UPI00131B38B1|nr:hypothetical protein [Methylocapsa sp. S129]